MCRRHAGGSTSRRPPHWRDSPLARQVAANRRRRLWKTLLMNVCAPVFCCSCAGARAIVPQRWQPEGFDFTTLICQEAWRLHPRAKKNPNEGDAAGPFRCCAQLFAGPPARSRFARANQRLSRKIARFRRRRWRRPPGCRASRRGRGRSGRGRPAGRCRRFLPPAFPAT